MPASLARFSLAALALATLATAGCNTPPAAPASCRSSRDCSGVGLVCDPASSTCVECVADVDCLEASTVCRATHCVPVTTCRSSRECPNQVCDTALGYCVDCLTDVDCPTDQVCESATCVVPPTACTSDRQCSGMGQVCDTAAAICVDCVRDADCIAGGSCVQRHCAIFPDAGPPPSTDEVDLLLMIDNSNSMTEEQQSVVIEIPRVVQVLTSGDRDGDGTQDFVPARSLHIGIVDSDMGLGSTSGISTCDPGVGDDGLLQIRARQALGTCRTDYSSTYPDRVFTFVEGGATTPAAYAGDVGCVAALGTDGCGFEFELEAPLKALSPAPTATGASPVSWTAPGYVPPVFASGTGHGVDPSTNGAFLRPTSVLAIVTVNDEDDCSTDHYEIFSLDETTDLNLRCHVHAGQLFPTSRYVDGFLGLRTSPSRLVFASITGVPPDLSGAPPSAILADARMVEREDPGMPGRLVPVCVSPGGRGVATPAVRMTRVAEGLAERGAHVTVQSICNDDYSGAFDVVVQALADAL
ncbi:MAG: hypothetical protein U0234_31320 [Sandaracinus sp.]